MTEAISWKYRRSFLTPRNDRLEPGVFVQALNKITLEVRNCQNLFLTFLEKHPYFQPQQTNRQSLFVLQGSVILAGNRLK